MALTINMWEKFDTHLIDFIWLTKFELPKVEDLQLDNIPYDAECGSFR